MPTYRSSTSIAIPQDVVWNIFSHVAGWPQWLPTIDEVDALDGHPLRLGARYRIVQPKLRPATWQVTCMEPPRLFSWEARLPGLTMKADHLIEAAAPGHSRVVLSMSFSGALGALAGWRFRSTVKRYLDLEASALKARAEERQVAPLQEGTKLDWT